jgi:hypothetical protein
MFQPLRGHLHGVNLIQSSSVCQQNESPDIFNSVCSVYSERTYVLPENNS